LATAVGVNSWPNFFSDSYCMRESMRTACVASCARSSQHALDEAQVLVQQRARRRLKLFSRTRARSCADSGCRRRALRRWLFGVGSQDEAPAGPEPSGNCASTPMRARSLLAQLVRAIFCEMPMVVVMRQEDGAGRPAMLTCVDKRRALRGRSGSLMTCTVSAWPSKTRRSIGIGGALTLAWLATARRCRGCALRAAIDLHVRDVQETRRVPVPMSNERRLHSGSTRATRPV